MKNQLSFLFLLFCLLSCSQKEERAKAEENNIAVLWELIANGLNGEDRNKAAFTFINKGQTDLKAEGWTLFFNQMPKEVYPNTITGGVTIDQINGDFFQLKPTSDFLPLSPGDSLRIEYEASLWAIKKSDAPTGLYFIYEGRAEAVLVEDYTIAAFIQPEQINRNQSDTYPIPTAANRYEQNATLSLLSPDKLIPVIPTPVEFRYGTGQLELTTDFVVVHTPELKGEAAYLVTALQSVLGSSLEVGKSSDKAKSIQLILSPISVNGTTAEAYQLTIDPAMGIRIEATEPAGIFYGIQTLRNLIPPKSYGSPASSILLKTVQVKDAPRFPYRGLHLDVARNFHQKSAVLKLLELMSIYKLNRFHFHITDDEGWRLEMDDLEELTQVGGKRGHTATETDHLRPAYGSGPQTEFPGSGYYSKAEFIEILQYAQARHIEVIPEIDMPGHARAAIKAMEARYHKLVAVGKKEAAEDYLLNDFDDQSEYSSAQEYNDNVICVCRESVYRFLEKVVDNTIGLFKMAGVPLNTIHIGGDEVPKGVWEKSPKCAELIANNTEINNTADLWPYFIKRFNKILTAHNLNTGGWEEIAMRIEEKNGSEVHVINQNLVDRNVQPYVWNAVFGWGGEDLAYRLANAGFPIVICNASNLYFDLSYNKDPDEPGLYWAGFVDTRKAFEFLPFDLYKSADLGRFGEQLDPITIAAGKVKLTDKGRQNILGIQGQLWSETILNEEMAQYSIFPKLLGMAERAWANTPEWASIEDTQQRRRQLNKHWNIFANTLGQRELPRLDFLQGGIHYRLPPPGAIIEQGQLLANTAYPGLSIRYTTDGSEPDENSKIYSKPIPVAGTIKLRTFSTNGRASRTISVARQTPN